MLHPLLARKLAAMACFAVMLTLASCNAQKKNTALSRQYTAFITRYNIHYNGDKHFKETLADMEADFTDDYSRLLPMHPVEAKGQEVAPGTPGPFDRSIEKAQKAIQVRSIKKKPRRQPGRKSDPEYQAWLARDEYNPFLHNDWLLMGKSQYFNADFGSAAATFMYIAKHFDWLPDVVTEAKLWQALACVSQGSLDEADIILTRIKPSQLHHDKELTALYNYVYADYWIHRKQYAAALPYLEVAAAHATGPQHTRLTFLLGQIYQITGNKPAALQAYKRAGSGASTPHLTKFNARIKQSEVAPSTDAANEIKALKRMARYERNKQYAGQIRYAIANLLLSQGDTASAAAYYRQAIDSPGYDNPDAALARLALARIYYNQASYLQAQELYAAAVPALDEEMADYNAIKKRSEVLDKYAVYARNVALQDSLLTLAAMTPQQQRAAAQKMVEQLQELERRQAKAQHDAQNITIRSLQPDGTLRDTNARQFVISNDDSWYFYNQSAKEAGKAAFRQQWGARPLEDDWRRSNKHSLATEDYGDYGNYDDASELDAYADSSSAHTAKPRIPAADPHSPEFYLAQIPSTPAEIASANDIVQQGLYNMGLILKDDMENATQASQVWHRLLHAYPHTAYRLDIYYNMYLMEMQQHHPEQAEHWRQQILTQFADSPQGHALKSDRYFEHLMTMDREQEQLYADTYRQYLANANDSVHASVRHMRQTYPSSQLMPQFMLLDALAYLTDGNQQKFNATLREMVERYPDAANATLASAWLKDMARGRQLKSTGRNIDGSVWDIPLQSSGSASIDSVSDIANAFTRQPDSPQVIALLFPTDAVSSNELLYQIARHNFSAFVVKDFDLEVLNFGTLGIILISGFDNNREVDQYMAVMKRSVLSLPPEVKMVPLSRHDFDTIIQRGLTFDHYFQSMPKPDPQAP